MLDASWEELDPRAARLAQARLVLHYAVQRVANVHVGGRDAHHPDPAGGAFQPARRRVRRVLALGPGRRRVEIDEEAAALQAYLVAGHRVGLEGGLPPPREQLFFQPCQGQTRYSPSQRPTPSGPPAWLQTPESTAYRSPSRVTA